MIPHIYDPAYRAQLAQVAGRGAWLRLFEMADELPRLEAHAADIGLQMQGWRAIMMIRKFDRYSRDHMAGCYNRWEEAVSDVTWCRAGIQSMALLAIEWAWHKWADGRRLVDLLDGMVTEPTFPQ